MRGKRYQQGAGAKPHLRIARGFGLGIVLVSVIGCLDLRESETTALAERDDACSGCHGEPQRDDTPLLSLAPPRDLKGNRGVEYPGVGAHTLHLVPRAGYAAVTCDQCHVVPTAVRQRGHIDSAPPAEVDFEELTKLPDTPDPHYDATSQTCRNTYCHGGASGTWTHPRSSSQACGSCHGLPPAWPHPQSDACNTCHGEVIAADGSWIAPQLHVNQRVEVEDPSCDGCHGSELNPAPPRALDGNTERDNPGVGAHQAHLQSSLGRALACSECHKVPATPAEPGHLDGSGVDVALTGVAQGATGEPAWDAESQTCAQTWCHGVGNQEASPQWSHLGPLSCTSCHGMPPAVPHPQVANCSLCHAEVAGTESGELVTARHVDGVVDVSVSDDCSSCHGSAANPAPPRDLRGNTDTSLLSVGAHQAHLVGRGLARVLECSECHSVPEQVNSDGHIDDVVADAAEVVFSGGVATAFSAQPRYEAGSCAQTFCHGDSFIAGGSGGNHTTPVWNIADGSQVTCTSCHGMPPPTPHPQEGVSDCAQCHRNMDTDGSFTHPERHVDGIVTFYLERGDQLNP